MTKEYRSEEDRIYYQGVNDGLQRALDIVNGNWDAVKGEWAGHPENFDPVELIARIVTDLQTAS